MAIVTWGEGISGAHGKVGNSVLVRTKYGTVLRSKPLPTGRTTPAQEAQNRRFGQAVEVYRTLTPTENAAWKEFALSPLNHNPDTGKPNGINAYTAFMGLAMRFVMVSPESDIPRMPPTFPFSGDPVTFTVAAVVGQLTITASGANSAGIVTELLIRPVKFPMQSVRPQDYTSAAFVSFTLNELTVTLNLAPGCYRLATRFVDTTTGQATYRQSYDAVQVLE